MYPTLFDGVPSYGVFRVLSFAFAAWLLVFTARRYAESDRAAVQLAVALCLGSFLGGRGGWVLLNLDQPGSFFSGGFVAFTAFLGGAIFLLVTALVLGRHVGAAFDLVTPSVVGAWAVGNIGCFLAGCCAGAPTSLPWAVRFADGVPSHPIQLYAALFEVLALAALFALPRKFRGELTLRAIAYLLLMRLTLWLTGTYRGSVLVALVEATVFVATAALILLLAGRSVTPRTATPA